MPADLNAELDSSFTSIRRSDLVHRSQLRSSQPVSGFNFTAQLSDFRPESATRPPDNFDDTRGSYFLRKDPLPDIQKKEDHQQHQSTVLERKRIPPVDREAVMDRRVHEQMLQSLAEQEEDDRKRKEACQVQRQIERLKMQQRVKSRIQLQLSASQRPFDRTITEMGIDVERLLAEKPRSATMTSQQRAALCDEANTTFVKYNMNRMQYNLAHRQYCIESLQDRQRMRMAMERSIKAYYPAKKERQLKAIGAVDTAASRFPTVAELHKKQEVAEAAKRQEESEREIRDRQLEEMNEKAETLWQHRRQLRGSSEIRIRELPYDIDHPHVRNQELKPPHLPVKLRSVPL